MSLTDSKNGSIHIFDEAQPDYSAEVCTTATLDHLDPVAIEKLRTLW